MRIHETATELTGTFVTDPRGLLLYADPPMERLLESSRTGLFGHSIGRFLVAPAVFQRLVEGQAEGKENCSSLTLRTARSLLRRVRMSLDQVADCPGWVIGRVELLEVTPTPGPSSPPRRTARTRDSRDLVLICDPESHVMASAQNLGRIGNLRVEHSRTPAGMVEILRQTDVAAVVTSGESAWTRANEFLFRTHAATGTPLVCSFDIPESGRLTVPLLVRGSAEELAQNVAAAGDGDGPYLVLDRDPTFAGMLARSTGGRVERHARGAEAVVAAVRIQPSVVMINLEGSEGSPFVMAEVLARIGSGRSRVILFAVASSPDNGTEA